MSKEDIISLASSKDTTPEALFALMSDQDYFEQVWCATEPDELVVPADSESVRYLLKHGIRPAEKGGE